MTDDLHRPAKGSQEGAPSPSDGDLSVDNLALARNPSPRQGVRVRREFRWSKAARDLVRANLNVTGTEVSALVGRLVEESGNGSYRRWRCNGLVAGPFAAIVCFRHIVCVTSIVKENVVYLGGPTRRDNWPANTENRRVRLLGSGALEGADSSQSS